MIFYNILKKHLITQVPIFSAFELVTLLDYYNLFNTYSKTNLINITKVVMNDVTQIVPNALNVYLIDLQYTPINLLPDLFNVKYH